MKTGDKILVRDDINTDWEPRVYIYQSPNGRFICCTSCDGDRFANGELVFPDRAEWRLAKEFEKPTKRAFTAEDMHKVASVEVNFVDSGIENKFERIKFFTETRARTYNLDCTYADLMRQEIYGRTYDGKRIKLWHEDEAGA